MFKALILIFSCIPSLVFSQESESEVNDKLNNIKQRLVILKDELNQAYGEEQALVNKLQFQDKLISTMAKKISLSQKTIADIQSKITSINTNIITKTSSIELQKDAIVKLLKVQVYVNHNKTLKQLLSNSNNKQTTLINHQIKYLQHKFYQLINKVINDIRQLNVLQQSLAKSNQQEKLNFLNLEKQQSLIKQQRIARQKILTKLRAQINQHIVESSTLSNDQKRLQNLLYELKHLLNDLPDNLGNGKSFAQQKGMLSKPIKGKYIRSFNSRRSQSTKWNGVVLIGDYGEKIESIAYGRVAFADWLRGFGMLIILDHQDGYMSLYGFNESIVVEVGDWVNAHQQIATIGNSGTLGFPALYFEIRKDAKPLNPKKWLK